MRYNGLSWLERFERREFQPYVCCGDFSLAAWDISSATNMSNFVYNGSVKFSTASYDAGLIYWATLNVKLNVPLTIGTAKYSAAAASARAVLISKGWTIIDGGVCP